MIVLTVSGEFTALELAAFLSLIQGLDRPHTNHWSVQIVDDDPAEAIVHEAKAMLPPVPPMSPVVPPHRPD